MNVLDAILSKRYVTKESYLVNSRNLAFALTDSFESFDAAMAKCETIAKNYYAKRDQANNKATKLSREAEARRAAAIEKATAALQNALTKKADTATLRAEAKAYMIAVNFFKVANWLPFGRQALKTLLAFAGKSDVDVLTEMRNAAQADNDAADELEAEVAKIKNDAKNDDLNNQATIATTFKQDMEAANAATAEALNFQALAESFMMTYSLANGK